MKKLLLILFSLLILTCRELLPNVLYEPPQQFKIGFPEDFKDDKVTIDFKRSHNVWIVREQGKIFALSTICTHLGCTLNWLETDRKFKCPCHGCGFKSSGVNFEGPPPRPLDRYRIYLQFSSIFRYTSPKKGDFTFDKYTLLFINIFVNSCNFHREKLHSYNISSI